MYRLLKPLLFTLSAERAHSLTVGLFRIALAIPGVGALLRRTYRLEHSRLEREVFGLKFKNPIGLAAGFDKDGKSYQQMAELGFGFVEVGTVTPRPQVGNPQPRLFRLPADRALINRMGFNNEGVEALAKRLQRHGKPPGVVIGGNIGKNKDTPNEKAVEDYLICFDRLFPFVDYFVVNVSSPNTPNLRELQDREPLTHLLRTLQDVNQRQHHPKPLLLKIAPDLTDGQLDDIVEIAKETQLAGIIATNTTIARAPLTTSSDHIERLGNGGLSGAPLRKRATEVIRYLAQRSKGKIPIIGVGGVLNGQDALEKLEAGASLVQIYTGMVYEGPTMVREIKKTLLQKSDPTHKSH